MRKVLSFLFAFAMALVLWFFNAPSSTARAQAITIAGLNCEVILDVYADTNSAPYFNPTSTNLGPFSFDTSEQASDPTSGASASGAVSQNSVIMLQSNILYVAGSGAASGSAYNDIDSGANGSEGSASTELSIQFTVHTNCAFILQASTTYGPGYYVNQDGGHFYYPQIFVEFSSDGPDSFTFGQSGSGSPTYPASGLITGTLPTGYQTSFAGLATALAIASLYDGYPTADSQYGSISYSLTVYPTGTGGGSGGGSIPTNSPTLGMNSYGTNLVVSWPVIYPNYLLTTTTNLASTNWTVVPIPPSIVGNFWQVTNFVTAGAQFFRLVEQ